MPMEKEKTWMRNRLKSYKKKVFFSFIRVIININWQPRKYRKLDDDYYWCYGKMKRKQISIR